MKRNILTILGLLMVVGVVYAAPWAQTYPLNGSMIMLTNQQPNSVWIPVTVLWKFSTGTNAALTVSRVSQGNTFLIGNLPVTNASTVIWVPEVEYPFEFGDVLQLTSTVPNVQVQIIRKGN
ncbi:MAG: hypothetical protein WCI95_12550 [bacterium]